MKNKKEKHHDHLENKLFGILRRTLFQIL